MKLSFVLFFVAVFSCSHAQTGYTVAFSTYIGGSGYEQVRDVTTDDDGNIYITGGTSSGDFNTTPGSLQTKLNDEGQKIMDAFVMKLDSKGKLLWSTLIGGPEYDRAYAVEVDKQGNVYIAGRAGEGLPVTGNAFQPLFAGDTNANRLYGRQDGFIAKISPDGSRLIWCSYFGASDKGFIRDLALDSNNNAYIIATEASADYPYVKANAMQPQRRQGYEGIVAKIASDGSRVLWATYIGGSGDDLIGPSIRINSSQQVVVCGMTTSVDMPVTANAFDKTYNGNQDMYIGIINSQGTKLLLGTYLGGSGMDGGETHNLAIDKNDRIIIAATTSSEDMPVTADCYQPAYGGSGGHGTGMRTNYPFDGFVAKLSADGTQLLAATYLGGNAGEGLEGVATDATGNIYCGGSSYSMQMTNTGSIEKKNKGKADQIAACFSTDLRELLYFGFAGGEEEDYGRSLHADKQGNIYTVGETSSASFPAVGKYSGGGKDGTLTKIEIQKSKK